MNQVKKLCTPNCIFFLNYVYFLVVTNAHTITCTHKVTYDLNGADGARDIQSSLPSLQLPYNSKIIPNKKFI